MNKLILLRTITKSTSFRSARPILSIQYLSNSPTNTTTPNHNRSFFSISNTPAAPLNRASPVCRSPFIVGIGAIRSFSEDVSHYPAITDAEIERVFKDLMAVDWNHLPESVTRGAEKALSKKTDDVSGQEALANVFHAALAVDEFNGILTSLKMNIDDQIGMSGENVKPLSDEIINALRVAYQRYTTYLDAFGPHETYLRKKVETELGTRMIHLKMRCSGLGSEWGKVTVLGTSGLSGSYVEQRA